MHEKTAINLKKAIESLAGAESEFSSGRYNNCANRCSYGCYQAAVAALSYEGVKPDGEKWSHGSVPANFDGLLINRLPVALLHLLPVALLHLLPVALLHLLPVPVPHLLSVQATLPDRWPFPGKLIFFNVRKKRRTNCRGAGGRHNVPTTYTRMSTTRKKQKRHK